MYGWQCHKSCLWMVLNGAKNKFRIDEKFIQSFDDNLEDSDILEVDAKYPKKLSCLHNDLLFLSERTKIEIFETLQCNLYNKKNYVLHIKFLKQAVNHGLMLRKVPRVIEFNEEAGLKSYTDLNKEPRTKAKNDFEKDFIIIQSFERP